MAGRDYAYLFGLSALWGSSYLFVKIADDGNLAPALLVLLRVGLATTVLFLTIKIRGLRLPGQWRVWRSFAIMGAIGAASPFLLIAWGETAIDSSLAAILNATVPIFTVLLAHYWTRLERLTMARVAGIVIGFTGVVVLVGNASISAHGLALRGVAALLLSSLCYGIANNFARRSLIDVAPEVAAMGQMLFAAVCLAIPGIIAALTTHRPATTGALAAAVALALFGTAGAYLLYYRLISRVGSTRTASVAYLLPVFAVVYGSIFLHEQISVRLLFGFALILLGVAVVNGRVGASSAGKSVAAARAAG